IQLRNKAVIGTGKGIGAALVKSGLKGVQSRKIRGRRSRVSIIEALDLAGHAGIAVRINRNGPRLFVCRTAQESRIDQRRRTRKRGVELCYERIPSAVVVGLISVVRRSRKRAVAGA